MKPLLLCLILSQAFAYADPVVRSKLAFGGNGYQTVEVDLKQADLKLYWKKDDGTNYGTLMAVQKAVGRNFLFATNAGIYDVNDSPLGLEVERGQTLVKLNRSHASTGNFYMQPNGVFYIDGKGIPHILETAAYFKARPADVQEGGQSGPALVLRGTINPQFKSNSESHKLRSGIGINPDGHVIFALSTGEVSFYDFAVFFRDGLRCQDALFLDGTISTFLSAGATDYFQPVPFGAIWAASLRP